MNDNVLVGLSDKSRKCQLDEYSINVCKKTVRGPTLKFSHMVDIDVVKEKKIIIKLKKNIFRGQGQEV